MNDHYEIDDLFREQLGAYLEDPPPRIWKNIIQTIRKDHRKRPGRILWHWMTVVVLPAIIAGAIAIIRPAFSTLGDAAHMTEPLITDKNVTRASVIVVPRKISDPQSNAEMTSEGAITRSETKGDPGYINTNIVSGIIEQADAVTVQSSANTIPAGELYMSAHNPATGITTAQTLPGEEPEERQPSKAATDTIAPETTNNGLATTSPQKAIVIAPASKADQKMTLQKINSWQLSLNIAPEYLFNKNEPMESSPWKFTYELFGEYNYKGWVLEGGAGIGFSKIKTDHELSYKVNELKATYQDVIRIYWDTVSNSPAFVTETVNLYDSVQKNELVRADQKRTLLHLQLMTGYKKQYGKFAVTPKGGFSYTMVVRDKTIIPGPSVQGTASYRDITTDVAPNNNGCALLLDCGLSYEITRGLGITVEPSFRYYLKNIYGTRGDAQTKPCSIGLRAGVFVKIE